MKAFYSIIPHLLKEIKQKDFRDQSHSIVNGCWQIGREPERKGGRIEDWKNEKMRFMEEMSLKVVREFLDMSNTVWYTLSIAKVDKIGE